MEIPFELKIFSWIYEAGSWVLLLLLAGWFFCAWKLMCRARKVFFLWLLIFPLFLQPVQIAVVWCGWHYRMELRNRYARSDSGWTDRFTEHLVDIDRMPPAIRAEYAKHNYHPRFRDLKALAAGTIVFTPLLYLFGGVGWLIAAAVRKEKNCRQ